MNRKHYPSDISREQFEQLRPLLEGARKKTCPRRQDLYDIFCAIRYLLKNAATWRALPGTFPPPVRCAITSINGVPCLTEVPIACLRRH
jgi:transposase